MIEAFLFAIGFNILMFIPAYYFKTDKLTDISYALTFFFICTYLLLKYFFTLRFPHILLYLMVVVWAARLGTYLWIRIQKMGRDKRFDQMRQDLWKFLRFWFLQGFTVFIVLIPTIFVLREPYVRFRFLSLVGFLIFAFGLVYETIADYQKFEFMTQSKNKNKFISIGLWQYSRHPNYFGEICVWFGIYVYSLFYVNAFLALLGFISPLFIFLLLRYVSGIPLLEKSAAVKFKNNVSYQRYLKKTPLLFPQPWKEKK